MLNAHIKATGSKKQVTFALTFVTFPTWEGTEDVTAQA
jgi:hypothetical protein